MKTKTTKRRNTLRRNMNIEAMEDRQLFAADLGQFADIAQTQAQVTPAFDDIIGVASIILNDGVLTASGSHRDDVITIENYTPQPTDKITFELSDSFATSMTSPLGTRQASQSSTNVVVASLPQVRVTIADDVGDILQQKTFLRLNISEVVVNAGFGADEVYNETSIRSTINAGPGNDLIHGGSSNDTIYAHSGNDTVYGNGGNDYINGGEGNDALRGNDGNDTLHGSAGNDYINGGDGNDAMSGGTGADVIYGGNGNDALDGDSGDDMLDGGNGNDVLSGEDGNDTLRGQGGNDTMYGGNGNDRMYGGSGNDVMSGNNGNDTMYGSSGDDRMYGHAGNDEMFGDSGDDVVSGGDHNDSVTGGSGNDELWGGNGNDTMYGGSGNDEVAGGTGNDTMFGGSGNDTMWGWTGNDTMYGGSGNDTMYGGDQNDRMIGDAGNDNIYGNDGHDTLYGRSGNDYLSGGSGDDGLYGGLGSDDLRGGTGDDRFLVLNDVPIQFLGITIGMTTADDILDRNNNDAKINFRHGEGQTFNFSGGRWSEVAGGTFTQDEIQDVDESLEDLHRKTGNTKLLKRKNGDQITIQRLGAQTDGNFNLGGVNSGDLITLLDASFDGGIEKLSRIMFHEIGHNWDNENDNWDAFKGLSGWRQSSAPGYTQSTDGDWWYQSSATFARNYGKTNPMEDFATYFAKVMMEDNGMDYPEGSGGGSVQSKEDFFDAFFASL